MTSRHGWNQFWHWRPKTDSRFNDTTRPGWHWDLVDIGRTSDWCRLNYLTAVVRIYTQDRTRDRGSKSVRIEVKMTQLDLKMLLTIQCHLTWSVSANPKNDRLNLGSWISCKGLLGVSSTSGLSKASRFLWSSLKLHLLNLMYEVSNVKMTQLNLVDQVSNVKIGFKIDSLFGQTGCKFPFNQGLNLATQCQLTWNLQCQMWFGWPGPWHWANPLACIGRPLYRIALVRRTLTSFSSVNFDLTDIERAFLL